MASPLGDAGWNEPAKSRFFLNRGVQGGTVGPNDNSDPWNLPTMMANGGETAEPFNTAICTCGSNNFSSWSPGVHGRRDVGKSRR
ncbi:hypothetical protein [Sorangium sp. So ce426]|uniref:hypothetical protein n=1 Tax=Sorangium sp. So ce426 TaxID=3133312 RepID=UPI003F5B3122